MTISQGVPCMIRLFLNGGLGNQLFEYATARAVGIRTGASLEIDLRFYNAVMTGTPKGPWLMAYRPSSECVIETLRDGVG
jgi:hypothetical protein